MEFRPEADEVNAALFGVVLERGDLAAMAEADGIEVDGIEAAVLDLFLEDATAGRLEVAANDAVACGAASAVAAKSRTREVDFILMQ